MITIIFDIDGTLTSMWPLEKAILVELLGSAVAPRLESLKAAGPSDTLQMYRQLSGQKITKFEYLKKYNLACHNLLATKLAPEPIPGWLVSWILENRNSYRFVYATGGQKIETEYVLQRLGLLGVFELESSVSKSTCRFNKKTGLPYKKIAQTPGTYVVVSDSKADCAGALKAGIPSVLVSLSQPISLALEKISLPKK